MDVIFYNGCLVVICYRSSKVQSQISGVPSQYARGKDRMESEIISFKQINAYNYCLKFGTKLWFKL
jgi:hypothetical protein